MKYKYILMDADDTLLDFKEDETNAISSLYKYIGIEPTPLLINLYSDINLSFWKMYERGEIEKSEIGPGRFKKLLKELGIKGDCNEIDKKYRSYLANCGVTFPNTIQVCQKLKEKGYHLYIVTNGTESIQKSRFANAGFSKVFEKYFVSDFIGYQKPKVNFFNRVFEEIGCFDKSAYLIVGDSLTSDILGGKNAGIDTCWCNFRNKTNETKLVPDYTIENISQLLSIL